MGTESGRNAGIKVVLLLLSALYALLLSTPRGRRWAQQQTWATVVTGTGMTLGAMAAENRRLAGWAFWFFVTSGVPLVARSLLLQMADREEAERGIFGYTTQEITPARTVGDR